MLRAGVIVMMMMMMMMMMRLMVKDAWSLDATDVNQVAGLSPPSFEDSYGVVASDVGSDGRCTCSVLSPSDSVCSTDNRFKQIKYLHAQVEQLQAIVSDMQTGTFLQHYTELRRKIAAIEAERDLVLVSESEFLQLKQEIIILDRCVDRLRERLAACQEQYGDHSAVSGGYLFTRNGSIPVSCNDETLGGILQPITHAWESAAAQ
ncbi:PREDICTED: noelin-like, partial [Priapulus caudatus]|uniref:Noelin-like n=1 Tax=Priapulus caudatus TaxID=37621 RepID=A0ABM1F5S7_PRICU